MILKEFKAKYINYSTQVPTFRKAMKKLHNLFSCPKYLEKTFLCNFKFCGWAGILHN